MLKRKIFEDLQAWKNKEKKKCLVVKGARQVGKTFAVRQFGQNNYDEVIEINFKETPSAKDIFAGDLSIKTLLTLIRFRYPQYSLIEGKTLLFFDEIQECPEAITSLKFWSEYGKYDVISSGSLLGIDYKRSSSYPVGYVEYLDMYGLDFEEFLWAKGIDADLIVSLKRYFDECIKVPESLNTTMMSYLREYLAIGGMPEVVDRYIETNDYISADKIQRQILTGYQYDIAHYATAEEKVKAEKCYLSLSKQLLDKENHKFQYKEVEHGGRAQKYYSSIEWLERANIVSLCKCLRDVNYNLEDYARDDFFRAYTTDLSLLLAMKDFGLKQHIVENTLDGNTKGGLYECLIADILLKKKFQLFFYKLEGEKEIDFLIQKNGEVIAIEVKGSNSRATSLNWLSQNNKKIAKAYKFIDGNIGVGENGVVTMPLYMAMFI